MDATTKRAIAIYQEGVKSLQKIRADAGYNFVCEDGSTIDEEIARMEAHIRRLENNHAECVKPCCPGCTAGGT